MDVFLQWTKAIALIIGLGIEIGAGLFVLTCIAVVLFDWLVARTERCREFLRWYWFKRNYPCEYYSVLRASVRQHKQEQS